MLDWISLLKKLVYIPFNSLVDEQGKNDLVKYFCSCDLFLTGVIWFLPILVCCFVWVVVGV